MKHEPIAALTVRIWNADYPIEVEQDGDWWIAEPVPNKWGYCGASRHSAQDAVDRLLCSAAWHRRAA